LRTLTADGSQQTFTGGVCIDVQGQDDARKRFPGIVIDIRDE
jgi:hypothetical protein